MAQDSEFPPIPSPMAAIAAPPEPCPRCQSLEGTPDPSRYEGVPCPACGRPLPLPAGLPAGSVLTRLLALRLLRESLGDAWRTARDVLEDERLRTSLFAPVADGTPDASISLNRAEVPDPLSPAVEAVLKAERMPMSAGMHRLLFATRFRRAMLSVILRETYGAGFQRDETRVAARLGFPLHLVRAANAGKKLVRL